MRAFSHLAIVFSLLILLSGCGRTSSSVLPTMESSPNPQQGPTVRIETVQDLRHFEIKPPRADIPSLQEGDVHDVNLTARALGRKRAGFGLALGNVFLPEGQTVASLVKEATIQGFREAGYRVLTEQDPGYRQALPITAKINQFWGWGHLKKGANAISYRAEIQVDGGLPPLRERDPVWGDAEIATGLEAPEESDWRDLGGKALTDYTHNLRDRLRGAPPKKVSEGP